MKSTYIPEGYYLSKAQAANYLDMDKTTLQYHVSKGHIETINFPSLGHLIKEQDVLDFKISPQGRPSIYEKVK